MPLRASPESLRLHGGFVGQGRMTPARPLPFPRFWLLRGCGLERQDRWLLLWLCPALPLSLSSSPGGAGPRAQLHGAVCHLLGKCSLLKQVIALAWLCVYGLVYFMGFVCMPGLYLPSTPGRTGMAPNSPDFTTGVLRICPWSSSASHLFGLGPSRVLRGPFFRDSSLKYLKESAYLRLSSCILGTSKPTW